MTILNLSIDFTDAQSIGIAQARTAYNAASEAELTDIEYLQYVLIGAANSYAAQFSGAEPVAPSPIAPQTRSIDMRRLQLALLQMDILDTIDAAISQQSRAAQIEWNRATHVKADHPLVLAFADSLDLDVDAIFDLAETFT